MATVLDFTDKTLRACAPGTLTFGMVVPWPGLARLGVRVLRTPIGKANWQVVDSKVLDNDPDTFDGMTVSFQAVKGMRYGLSFKGDLQLIDVSASTLKLSFYLAGNGAVVSDFGGAQTLSESMSSGLVGVVNVDAQ